MQDSFKPEQNVRGGSTYLDALLTRYHDNLALALAAYNAGPAAVDRYHGIPPYRETRAYVARVIHEFNRRVLAREAQARQALAASASAPARTPLDIPSFANNPSSQCHRRLRENFTAFPETSHYKIRPLGLGSDGERLKKNQLSLGLCCCLRWLPSCSGARHR